MSRNMSRKRSYHFSLIELLVVVAIIGILASLVLPALSKARKTSQVAVCTNNLKQISTATFLYQDDSEGYYPAGNYANGVSWDDLLSSYDSRNLTDTEMQAGGLWGPTQTDLGGGTLRGDVYRCPLDNRIRTDDYLLKTYAHTQAFFIAGSPYSEGAGIIGMTDGTAPYSKAINNINDSANTIAYTGLADDDLSTTNDRNHIRSRMSASQGWSGIRAKHQDNAVESHHPNNKYNYSMVDGSIKQMTLFQSLIKNDGSIANGSNVLGSKWDSSK
jgi:prepilin-type N-terminal cleavage/methylation domain-containing protein